MSQTVAVDYIIYLFLIYIIYFGAERNHETKILFLVFEGQKIKIHFFFFINFYILENKIKKKRNRTHTHTHTCTHTTHTQFTCTQKNTTKNYESNNSFGRKEREEKK